MADYRSSLTLPGIAIEERVERGERARARGYKRLNAMALSAPAGLRIFQKTNDVAPDVARLRIYSDDEADVGERMRLEVFPRNAGGASLVLLVEVAWVQRFDGPSPARFEIGLDVKWLARRDAPRLAALL